MHTSDCTVYNICVLGIMSLLCKNKCSPDPRMSLTMAIWSAVTTQIPGRAELAAAHCSGA